MKTVDNMLDDNREFSLDDIIAEVKAQTTHDPLAEEAESLDEDTFFRPAHDQGETETLETVVLRPKKDDSMKIVPDSFSARGKRQKEEALREGERLLQEEDALAQQERMGQQAPWRTKRVAPPPDADTREFGGKKETVEQAPPHTPPQQEAAPLSAEGYDFINLSYDDAAKGAARLSKQLVSITSRLLVLVPLLAISVYMSICLSLGWSMPFGFTYLRHPYLYLLVLAVIQTAAMVLSHDVTAAGLWRLVRLRPTADSLVLFCALSSLAHVISIIVKPQWGGYLPFSCVAVFTCFFGLLAKRQRAEGLKRTYKSCLQGTVPTAVKLYEDDGLVLAIKTEKGAYIDCTEFSCRDTTEGFSEIYAPLAMVVTLALAFAASFGQQRPQSFLWCLAAISAVAAPAALLISSSLPVRCLTKGLHTSGSGLINSRRTGRLAKCNSILLRDGDLFPTGAVELMGMKIAQDQKLEHVLGCAAAMLADVGGGIARTFADFARQRDAAVHQAGSIRYYENGGMSAEIGKAYVLLGSYSFMMRMGVRVNADEVKKLKGVTVFMAIDGRFAGIFSLKYNVQPQPYQAFNILNHSKLIPFIATKDFSLDQGYLEGVFNLRADSTEYLDLLDRLRLSDGALGEGEDTLAFLSRDGMLPFAEVVAAAKKLRRSVRFNLGLSIASAGTGLFLMYFLTSQFKVSSATPGSVLLYLTLWLLAAILGTGIITKY